MRKSIVLKVVVWSAAFAALLVVAYIIVAVLTVVFGVFPILPGSRDPRLVGTWVKAGGKTMILRTNGGGQVGFRPVRSLTWGTRGDTFAEKHYSVDAYTVNWYRYSVSDDGKRLTLFRKNIWSTETYTLSP